MYNFFLKKRFKNNLVSIKKKPNKLTSKTREGFITMIKTNIFSFETVDTWRQNMQCKVSSW
jgi:hypothetical protein